MGYSQREREVRAAKQAIALMRENLSETIRVDDLAARANYSKFHFCRIFRKATGVTPGRFLSALRLKQARYLLLETDFTVIDISCAVGYNSVGTFTSRFTRSIGMSPSAYRRGRGFAPAPLVGPAFLDAAPAFSREAEGLPLDLVLPPECDADRVVVGAFRGPVPEGRPALLETTADRRVRLVGLPAGEWHLVASALPPGETAHGALIERDAQWVGRSGPVPIGGLRRPALRLRLRPRDLTDLPVLVAPSHSVVEPFLAPVHVLPPAA